MVVRYSTARTYHTLQQSSSTLYDTTSLSFPFFRTATGRWASSSSTKLFSRQINLKQQNAAVNSILPPSNFRRLCSSASNQVEDHKAEEPTLKDTIFNLATPRGKGEFFQHSVSTIRFRSYGTPNNNRRWSGYHSHFRAQSTAGNV